MIRISLPWLIEVIRNLDSINEIVADEPINKSFISLIIAEQALTNITNTSVYSASVRVSRQLGDTLFEQINSITAENDLSRNLTQWERSKIHSQLSQFKTALFAELNVMPTYFVTPKGGFDTSILIEDGSRLFNHRLKDKVPFASFDAAEVGKAIAFELATAAGFHLFRLLEAVLRRYWDVLSGGEAPPEPKTIGIIAASLEQKSLGEPKVYETLRQINKLHRNPLIHPEVVLVQEEAMALLGIVNSAIGAMLEAIPDAPTTTANVPMHPSVDQVP